MYQCAPTVHLYHYESLQQLKNQNKDNKSNDKGQYQKDQNKKLVTLLSSLVVNFLSFIEISFFL